ncbi:Putative Tfp pilus assembly protein PilV [Herminiimonas arsenicoxydans]|uniref:Tfp pilus assembly protein PilV n=1 Tax=Herminiimonas arsenicoxydans TaxID=204773 RepID=A4G9N7_HERAR|nr:Putative Tfp pilus assembly protein PilV [Herminiimonas arsenicoxydans]
MKMHIRYRLSSAQKGIVLLEGLIAILIFSVGILGAVGLQATMIKANSDAKYRVEAGLIVEQRISQMWVDQMNLANYAEPAPGTDISAGSGLPNGRRITIRGDIPNCAGNLSCFVVKVTWQQPGDSAEHNVTSVARVTGGV